MRLALTVTAIVLHCAMASGALGQDDDVRRLGTATPQITPVRFHSLWVYTGLPKGLLEKNDTVLEGIFKEFNVSFSESNAALPANARIAEIPNRGTKQRLIEENLRWSTVEDSIDDLESRVEANQIAFCYVMAHGEYDGDNLILQFGADRIPRSTLVNRLKLLKTNTRAKLVVLITDNCAEGTEAPVPGEADSPDEQDILAGVWRALYFGHHGFVDLVSTKPGETGFLVGNSTVFNAGFRQALKIESVPDLEPDARAIKAARGKERRKLMKIARDKYTAHFDKHPHDGVVSWKEFESHLLTQMELEFGKKRDALEATDPIRKKMEAQLTKQRADLIDPGIIGQP